MTRNKIILSAWAFIGLIIVFEIYSQNQKNKESEIKLTSYILNGGSWTCWQKIDNTELTYKLSPTLLGDNASITTVTRETGSVPFPLPTTTYYGTWNLDGERLEVYDKEIKSKLSGSLKIIDESKMEWRPDKYLDGSKETHNFNEDEVESVLCTRVTPPILGLEGKETAKNPEEPDGHSNRSQLTELRPGIQKQAPEETTHTAVALGPIAANPADICANPISDPDIRQCASEKFDKLDRELNQLYKSVMAKLTPDLQARLKREQIAWIRKKEAECNAPDQYGEKGYPAWMLNSIGCQMAETQRRMIELKAIGG